MPRGAITLFEREAADVDAEDESAVDGLIVRAVSKRIQPNDKGKVTAAAIKQPQARNQCAVQRVLERRSMKRCNTTLFQRTPARCAKFAVRREGRRNICHPGE